MSDEGYDPQNKLELLIQSKNLKEEEMEIIESVFDAVKRLTLLNKGLIVDKGRRLALTNLGIDVYRYLA